MRPPLPLAAWPPIVAIVVAGCSHKQTAPTPVASGVASSAPARAASTAASRTERPWTNAARTPSPPTVADLTVPMDVAMVLCSSALNLAPCGVIMTGTNDVMTCFAGCQTQIETVVTMTIQAAAEKCAAAPPPEAGPRACALAFPSTAAIDPEIAGKTCSQLCEDLAARPALTRSP